jgi:hypothetical protein
MSPTLASISSAYQEGIVDTGREAQFLFFVAFLFTFGFIRTSTHMIRAQVSWWPGNVEVGGTHIHHLVWGICLMMITGYIGVTIAPDSPWQAILAILFGVGMGLALDEFALWLDLKDVYWSKEGRTSIDAVIVAAALGGLLLVGFRAWIEVAEGVEKDVFRVTGALGALTYLLVLVNFAKEKFVVGVLGLFVPLVALIGAIRLGREHSVWAHFFYKDERRAKARARFKRQDAPFNKVWDRLRGRESQSAADSG